MFGFFRSVVEAVLEKGVRGLLEEVPGGKYFCDVAARVSEKIQERRKEAKREADERAEFEKIAQVSYEVARREAERAVQEVAAARGVALNPKERDAAVQWVAAIPEATRQSFKRKEDCTGTSVPRDFALSSADDVLKVLPVRPPRFSAGQEVPGRDEWKLEKPLGVGGFGEVWLARHTESTDLLVRAVKFCFDQTGRDLIREANLIGRVMSAGQAAGAAAADPLKHVVPLLDMRLKGDSPWLMFEYVDGGNLTDFLHRLAGKPDSERVQQTVAALKQLCRGIGVFHTLAPALVHRDLKPSNILFDQKTKRLRVTDFGIGAVVARETNRQESRGESTHGGRLQSYLRGSHTPTYSSPEQRQGADPNPRDDVHALGVIGYQLLMSDLRASPGVDMVSDLEEKGAQADLIRLLADCVARVPTRRPANAIELLDRLEKVGQARSVPAPVVSPPPAAVKPPPIPKSSKPASPPTPAVAKPTRPASSAPERRAGEEVPFPLPGGLTMRFCWVPAGTVQLGSPETELDAAAAQLGGRNKWQDRESELHQGTFTTKGFWLGKYPVTQAEWRALMGDNPSHFQAGGGGADKVKGMDTSRFPVERVSWDDCQKFLGALNALGREAVFGHNNPFALPHEDAWEYACRGGNGNKQPFYWGHEFNGSQANANGSLPFGPTVPGRFLGRPCPVDDTSGGQYKAHPWGLCHMHGNVWEWCDNFLHEKMKIRIYRGGAWSRPARDCRAAGRSCGAAAGHQSNELGFRVFVPGPW